MTRRRGFTLIELLIVVAIIGIIVAIAVVNMINAIQRAKQKRSMGDMKSIATAIEAYSIDRNFYPAAAGYSLPSGLSLPTGTIGTVSDSLSPTYMRIVPLVDGWSSYFTYGTNASRSDFALCSAGADGALETTPSWGITTNFNDDIILVDGAFTQYPEGAQR
jgi:general secretion pathway protein G